MGFLSDAAGAVSGAFSGGGIGGALAGGFLGGPMGAQLGAIGGNNLLNMLSPEAIAQAQFQPYPITSPFGSMTFDPSTRQVGLELSPEQQAIQGMFSGAMAGGPFGLSPEQMILSGLGSGLSSQAFNLGGQAGLFGRSLGQQAAGAGSQFLSGAMNTDPQAIASRQFNRMQALLAPARDERRQATENRLLRQGLLTSSAGNRRFGEIAEAENMQDIKLAESALREGFQTQQGLFGMGLQGIQAGQGLFGAGTGQQLSAMGQGFGFAQAPQQQRQQALQNFMTLFGGQQQLGNQLFQLGNLGLGMGAQQSGVDAANAAAANAAAQNRSDIFAGLLGSGIGLLGGM